MKTASDDIQVQKEQSSLAGGRDGKIGYLIAWLLGVPASVLMLVFLVRGN